MIGCSKEVGQSTDNNVPAPVSRPLKGAWGITALIFLFIWCFASIGSTPLHFEL
jgi:hypothetical protein